MKIRFNLTILTVLILVAASTVSAQRIFNLPNASAYFDIKVSVAKCNESSCMGKASFSFYKKGSKAVYQIINLPDTYLELSDNNGLMVNSTLLYDKQSAVNVGDYNFDGMEDVAISNGNHGSYGMPSYQVYLSSKAAHRFVYDKAFSLLGKHLGMFELDKEKKVLRTFDKSGCCFHVTEEFAVVNNAPKKVLPVEEDATTPDEKKVKITTRTLVNDRWQTKVKFKPREVD